MRATAAWGWDGLSALGPYCGPFPRALPWAGMGRAVGADGWCLDPKQPRIVHAAGIFATDVNKGTAQAPHLDQPPRATLDLLQGQRPVSYQPGASPQATGPFSFQRGASPQERCFAGPPARFYSSLGHRPQGTLSTPHAAEPTKPPPAITTTPSRIRRRPTAPPAAAPSQPPATAPAENRRDGSELCFALGGASSRWVPFEPRLKAS